MGDISELISGAKYDRRVFARSQTTQLMAGSTGEDDRTIMQLSAALYRKYRLSRVYYTAFTLLHEAAGYEPQELPHTATPYWRMARLYQADRLQQLYGFSSDDVTPPNAPNLDSELDPKAAWALRNLSLYPVEVNRADFDTLIRVPGIGLTYARRIIEARRSCTVTHDLMRKLRIPLKRCAFFITCGGRYEGGDALDSLGLRYMLAMSEPPFNRQHACGALTREIRGYGDALGTVGRPPNPRDTGLLLGWCILPLKCAVRLPVYWFVQPSDVIPCFAADMGFSISTAFIFYSLDSCKSLCYNRRGRRCFS